MPSHFLFGCTVTAGRLCMYGSAIYFTTTGMSKSQARMDLSSDVVTKRRFSSIKLMVLQVNADERSVTLRCLASILQRSLDRTQVLVVFLCDLARSDVVLNDLLV